VENLKTMGGIPKRSKAEESEVEGGKPQNTEEKKK